MCVGTRTRRIKHGDFLSREELPPSVVDPLMRTQRGHSGPCYLILLAGRLGHWPGEYKGILFRNAEA